MSNTTKRRGKSTLSPDPVQALNPKKPGQLEKRLLLRVHSLFNYVESLHQWSFAHMQDDFTSYMLCQSLDAVSTALLHVETDILPFGEEDMWDPNKRQQAVDNFLKS